MSKVLLRTIRPAHAVHSFKTQPQRAFITLPGTESQSLSASRILPYNSVSLYKIIADVDNYSEFVPYCLHSKVTKWASEDGEKVPSEATLKVGWGGIEEEFTSRLHCTPGSSVEAISGEEVSGVPENSIFKALKTKWSIKPFHYKPPNGRPDEAEKSSREQSEVALSIDFSFSNPIYTALSKAAAPKVAGIMIEAFEVRARKLLDGPGVAVHGKDPLQAHFDVGKKAEA